MSSSSRRVSSASSRSISSRAIARSSSSRVGRVAQLARAGQLGPGRLEAAEGLDDRLEPGQLLAEPADRGRVASRSRDATSSAWTSSYWRATSASLASRSLTPGRRVGRQGRTGGAVAVGRSVAARHRVPAPARDASARCSNSAEPAGIDSPSASSACSIETIATSIMSSVGCFVVIIWTRRPGYSSTLTIGFVAVARARTAGSRSRPPR